MNKSYNPVKLTIIVVIGFIMFGVFGYLYEKESTTETWIVCNFPKKYDYYSEVIKYRFIDDLYGYYREEVFLPSTDMTLDQREAYFNDIKDKLEENDDFSYKIENDGIKVTVKTYINVNHYVDFYNDYIKEFNITNKSTVEEVNRSMTNMGYKCEITRK